MILFSIVSLSSLWWVGGDLVFAKNYRHFQPGLYCLGMLLIMVDVGAHELGYGVLLMEFVNCVIVLILKRPSPLNGRVILGVTGVVEVILRVKEDQMLHWHSQNINVVGVLVLELGSILFSIGGSGGSNWAGGGSAD